MWPRSLRNRLLLLMIAVVALPTLVSGYLMAVSAEAALMEEKQEKLFGAARMLERHLDGTFDDILARQGCLDAAKDIKVAALNRELQPYTDLVADVYPGIGVGYYVKDLDIQATYGPSRFYAKQVGLAIGPEHQGRIVMATGEPRVQVGELMRGPIMNAMLPIIRNGQVVGYIYANELTAAVEEQSGMMKRQMYFIMVLGLLVGVSGIFFLVNKLTLDIKKITDGLTNLKLDLTNRIPKLDGEMGEIAATINDMSQELLGIKQLEEQVQYVERLTLVGEVAAGLAHDIRNPLMAIRGFAQLLQENSADKEQAEYAAIIVKETKRMDKLIEQLLTFARPAKGEIALVDINQVLDSTLLLINTKATLGQIEIIREGSADLPLVRADGEQLRQVLLNILINSVQAITTGEGRIFINAYYEQEAEMVHICIQDTGIGIPPENLDKIFNPFFTTKPQGTGLGLAVAHRLVESWDGKIIAESLPEGGSLFTVVLTCAKGVSDNG
jgi:two-component system sensor histidine kinase HydH